jgi:sugar O-acyltransferase (sialic acid O-acetyltransferase NeuD family)
VVPFEQVEVWYPPDRYSMFIAVGYTQLNQVRTIKYNAAKRKGYSFITYISSQAVSWDDLVIGDNCFLMEHVVVQPFVRIGNGLIVWSGAHITHDTVIGDHCFIAANCVIAGNVRMGSYCFAGVNSTLRDGITVGDSCLIGAGALLLNDAPDNSVYVVGGTERAPFASRLAKNFL